ncbi:MAG: class I SAM-dependent methyltransferase [Euryarchaeota archaeon]|nr:class I SAM-dependent methyltransferase [Euryarchaeota archaeon]MDE1879651.1 class I SAM-dependent methyltransferase [Euryarchaeota archaeon]MDE2045177.1 class I SAM-dependent methyltransferase [Thermoplasmata archaeon]
MTHPRWTVPVPTVENRWDLLYSDYPEVYHEFESVVGTREKQVHEIFDLKEKVVLDAGSGTGKSSLPVSRIAKEVIGIDIERPMAAVAKRALKEEGADNVEFLLGDARSMPLQDGSVDVVMGITLAIYPPEGWRAFAREATRVVKNGGLIVVKAIPPGWYGGELDKVIADVNELGVVDAMFSKEFGFRHKDFYATSNYGTVEKMLRTYGFIFGKKAIDYIIDHRKTSIRWKHRYHYKIVKKPTG